MHVHGATRNNDAAHARVSPAEVECEVSSIIRRGLNAHGGSFDPARICSRELGIGGNEESAYSALDRLLQPGELREFIELHPEFKWRSNEHESRRITWASSIAPSFASASDQCPESHYETFSSHVSQGNMSSLPATVEAPGFASATGSASTQESPKVTTAPLDIFPFYN